MSGPDTTFVEPTSQAAIRVCLPVFEGPLDLLLHLLKRNELSVHEVTASAITEQYLRYLSLLEELDLEVASEYLVMAATLLLIKSASLLPRSDQFDDQDEEAEGLKQELIERLSEYERYRNAAERLAELPLLGRDAFVPAGRSIESVQSDSQPMRASVWDLVDALEKVLKRVEQRRPKAIGPTTINVASRIPVILAALERMSRIAFESLFEEQWDRLLVVATFLALLELVRRGDVVAFQEGPLKPIWIERSGR